MGLTNVGRRQTMTKTLFALLLLAASAPAQLNNAKSIWSKPIDNSTLADGYVLTWSAAAGKYIWAAPAVPGGNPTPTVLVDGATITVNATLSARYEVTLAGSRTVTVTNPGSAYQIIAIAYKQDGTGSRIVTYSNAVDSTQPMCNLWPAPNTVTTQLMQVKADGATLAGLGCIAPVDSGVETAAPTSAQCGAGVGCTWWDSTTHVRSSRSNGSSSIQRMVTGAAQPFDAQVVQWIGTDGSQNRGPIRPDPTIYTKREEFDGLSAAGGNPSANGWLAAGTGASITGRVAASTSAPSTKGRIGYWQLSTNTSGNAAYLSYAASSGLSLFTGLGSGGDFTSWYSRFSLLLNPTINSGVPQALQVASFATGCVDYGNANGASPLGTAGTFGVCVSTASTSCTSGAVVTGNFFLSSNVGGTTTCADTGVAALSSTWYDIDIYSTTLGTVVASVNGSSPVSVAGITNTLQYPIITFTPTAGVSTVAWIDKWIFMGLGTSGQTAMPWQN
jgi:hypothetical protein